MPARNDMRILCASAVALFFATSCVTKPNDTNVAQDSGTVNAACLSLPPSFSSLDAGTSARRCGMLPEGVVLASVASEADLDGTGAASSWGLVFVDPKSGLSYRGLINATSVSIGPASAFGSHFNCTTPSTDVASSNQLVPDARARVAARGVAAGIDRMFFRAMGECPGLTSAGRIDVWMHVDNSENGSVSDQWWNVIYSRAGQFDRICGPCSERTDASCATCSGG